MSLKIERKEYIERAIVVLEALFSVKMDLYDLHHIGMVLSVPDDVGKAFVAKHGTKGTVLLAALRGDRIGMIASTNVKTIMRLED